MEPVETHLIPKKENSFCSYPWNNVQIHVSGQLRPCTMMHDLGIRYKSGSDLQKTLNHPLLNEIKRTLLAGGRPEVCAGCHDEERLGIPSARLSSRALALPARENELRPILSAEISITNSCNLDCVMCRPVFSTKVEMNHREFHAEQNILEERQNFKPFNISEKDVESLIEQFQFVKSCRLIGGEPLMTKAGRKFIKLWGEKKISGTLEVITNGSCLDEEILKDVAACDRAMLNISIDGHGKTYEWIRGHPWQDISQKIVRANEMVKILLIPTVQAYNLFNIPDLAHFCETHNIKLRLGHILRDPDYLSMLIWPLAVRKECAAGFRDLWGNNKNILLDLLERDEKIEPRMMYEFQKWTRFMNKKRGFSWESIDKRHQTIPFI